MPEPIQSQGAPALTTSDKIGIQFEEYRALYGLAEFRLASLDRRATLAWAALGVFLAGFEAVNEEAREAFLLGVPMAVFWLLRTTINHARSFEDAIRRIDQIECAVNAAAQEALLAFQSSHPSRGRDIGGRTGRGTVLTVLATGLAMLATCGYLFLRNENSPPLVINGYTAYLCAVALALIAQTWSLRRYRYHTATGQPPAAKRFTWPWKSRRTRRTPPSTPGRKRR